MRTPVAAPSGVAAGTRGNVSAERAPQPPEPPPPPGALGPRGTRADVSRRDLGGSPRPRRTREGAVGPARLASPACYAPAAAKGQRASEFPGPAPPPASARGDESWVHLRSPGTQPLPSLFFTRARAILEPGPGDAGSRAPKSWDAARRSSEPRFLSCYPVPSPSAASSPNPRFPESGDRAHFFL